MKKRIVSTLSVGLVVLAFTGCASKGDMAKKALDNTTQASDGTTNTGATVVEGAGVGAVTGAVIGKQLGVGSGVGAAIGSFFGGLLGKGVDDTNKEQAQAEKKVADETADYDAKTAELKEKM